MKLVKLLLELLQENSDIMDAIQQWVQKLNQTEAEDFKKQGYVNVKPAVFAMQRGPRWIKITSVNHGGEGQKSVFAFVDPENGDIYKPAGWNAPAKGVRGNVTNPNPPLRMRDLYR